MNESVDNCLINKWQNSASFISDSVDWWHDVEDFDGFGPGLEEESDKVSFR
jgi:hypothetical protein